MPSVKALCLANCQTENSKTYLGKKLKYFQGHISKEKGDSELRNFVDTSD